MKMGDETVESPLLLYANKAMEKVSQPKCSPGYAQVTCAYRAGTLVTRHGAVRSSACGVVTLFCTPCLCSPPSLTDRHSHAL